MSYRSSWTGKILDGKREDNFSGLERVTEILHIFMLRLQRGERGTK